MGLLFFREKYIFSYENNNYIYYKGERIMSKKSIILTVTGICCGVIIGVNGCKLYEKLTDNHQTHTDMEIAESFAYDKYGDDKSEIVLRNHNYETDMLDFYIYIGMVTSRQLIVSTEHIGLINLKTDIFTENKEFRVSNGSFFFIFFRPRLIHTLI